MIFRVLDIRQAQNSNPSWILAKTSGHNIPHRARKNPGMRPNELCANLTYPLSTNPSLLELLASPYMFLHLSCQVLPFLKSLLQPKPSNVSHRFPYLIMKVLGSKTSGLRPRHRHRWKQKLCGQQDWGCITVNSILRGLSVYSCHREVPNFSQSDFIIIQHNLGGNPPINSRGY